MRRTVAALVTGSLLALGATGCTEDEPQPKMPDTSTPSTPAPSTSSESQSPSGSDTPSGPGTPQAWEEHSEDGADAFVRHWIDLFNDARLNQETDPLREASTPECATCKNFADMTDQWASEGATYQGEPWSIEKLGIQPYGAKEATIVAVIKAPPDVLREPGQDPQRMPGGNKTLKFTIKWQKSSWLMHEVVEVQ